VSTKKGIVNGKNFISKSDFVFLNEKLSRADEEEIRKMVREMMKKIFWRMYTRSAFFVQ